MKKIISILLVSSMLFISADTTAQTATTMPLAAGDTVTNTGTANKVVKLTAGYAGIYIQADVRKLSGTVGGTLGLYASLDGTSYVQIGNDTVTNTSGTKAYTFSVAEPVPVYLKVLHTGTGTMSSVLTVRYVLRKHD